VRVIDAHHHLWDLNAVSYPWLMARGVRRFFGDPTPIQKDYLPADFRADHDGIEIAGSVHVQVGAAPEASTAETAWLNAQGEATGLPSAIVAFADLTSPDLAATLDAHAAAAPTRLRGIRQIVSRHPSEDQGPDLLALLAFQAGLRALAKRGLSFDLQLSAPLLERAADVFAGVPDLPVALCHAGSPWDQSPAGLAAWRAGLAAMAALPNTVCKLSGLGMFNPAWTPEDLAPIIDGVLQAFGPDRVLWGSNFPVDKLYRPYRALFEAVWARVPEANREAVFAVTAARFYRL
jgi:predicted TIM-barrel fold metal-dependent hydrolase